MFSTINRRKAILGGAATVAALAMPAVVAAEISSNPTLMPIEPASPDAELVALGLEFDRLDAEIAEVDSLLKPTDAEAERLRAERSDVMRFTGRDFLWFGSANGNMEYWTPYYIDALQPYVPQSEYDRPAWPNARIAELKAARDAWAQRNLEFSIRTGRGALLQRMEALYTQLDRVEQRIVELQATSISGLIVKAKAAKRESALWNMPFDELDYDQCFYRDLIDNVLALAGMPT